MANQGHTVYLQHIPCTGPNHALKPIATTALIVTVVKNVTDYYHAAWQSTQPRNVRIPIPSPPNSGTRTSALREVNQWRPWLFLGIGQVNSGIRKCSIPGLNQLARTIMCKETLSAIAPFLRSLPSFPICALFSWAIQSRTSFPGLPGIPQPSSFWPKYRVKEAPLHGR